MTTLAMQDHPITFFEKNGLTPRKQQEDVLGAVYEAWGKYDYFALSCPTGVGKTYIATSIADAARSAYILTSTLQLQAQYEKSWASIVNLKGRGNYQCNINPRFRVDAAPCAVNQDLMESCKRASVCAYYNQKNYAIKSRAMITNPVYMLYSSHCGFAKDEDAPWVKRKVLVIDEAHNLESHMVNFAESDVDPQSYRDEFGCDVGVTFTGDIGDDYASVQRVLAALTEKAAEMREELERAFPIARFTCVSDPREWARAFSEKTAEKVKKMSARMNAIDKAIQPLKIFFNTHETPNDLRDRWIVTKKPGENVLKLAPIYGGFLFREYFGHLADKFVFLSATLGSKKSFAMEVGVQEDELFFMETPSPFPPERSPVVVAPSLKLSKDAYAANAPMIGPIVDEIMKIHRGQRGIVHSTTYDIQKHVFEGVSDESRRRILCRDMCILAKKKGARKRKNEDLLEAHEKSLDSVLLSPSMHEGVDLRDDLSAFQIIIKLPWAYLGDERVRAKSRIDPYWYTNKMWLGVLQASGRSTRHDEDSSVTYILDASFPHFYSRWRDNLPAWFRDRVVFL